MSNIEPIQPLHELKGHQAPILTVEYSGASYLGDHILASGSEDNTCRLWDLKTHQVIKGIKNLQEPVTSIKFGNKTPHLYLSSGTSVHTYDLRADGIILTEPLNTYNFSQEEINDIDVNENNKFLATADDNGVVNVIDLSTHKIYKKTTKKHNSICMSVKFRAKKSWEVWSGGMDSKLYEWDFSRGAPVNIHDMSAKEPSAAQMFNPPFVYKVATSPDGEWVAASLGDSSIQLLSPPNKKQKKMRDVRLVDGHNSMVNCLSFTTTTDKSLNLISGAANGRISLWNPTAEEPLQKMYQLDKSIGKVNSLASFMMGDELRIAVAGTSQSNAGALKLYQL